MQLTFDATQVEPRQGGGVCLPLGDYPFEIIKTEGVPVKDKPDKGMLVVTLGILDGPYKGQTQDDRLNLFNDNETAVRIAYQRLSAYCHVGGKLQISDTSQLVGIRGIATIGPQLPPNEKYSGVIKVKDLQGNEPQWNRDTTLVASAPPMPTQGASSPAWANPAQQSQSVATTSQTSQPVWNQGASPAPAANSSTPPWAR